MLLKNCSYILTQDSRRRILKDYSIEIEGNRIKRIAKSLRGKGINCKGKIVMPGLINTHAHLGMHSLKGICDDETLFDWLDIVNKEEAKLSVDDILKNTEEGIKECIRNGTTTIYDSYKYAPERIRIFEKLGMRGLVSSTVTKEKHLKHINRLLHETEHSPLVKPVVAGHSPYRCPQDLLEKIMDISEEHNLMRRIHIAETKQEVEDTLRKTGMTSIKYLNSFGFLGPRTLLVHTTFVDAEEVNIIAKRGSFVSHNPISNMKLGSGGVSPIIRMLSKGINVGLGTDSVVSNNSLDMFEELKTVCLLHKHHNGDPKCMTYQKAIDMATLNGARCLGLKDVGAIKTGMKADIITLDLDGLHPLNNVASNIVYCANGHNVCETIINGKIVMEDKKLVTK
jgi:5-methylthioadenosine/S-adenosylhomocysteine deaminase